MARVLVTGGTGFIGRRVVRRFLDRGWDASSLSLPGEAADPAWPRDVRLVHGDMLDRGAVAAAAEGCTLAVHLAAPVGTPGRYDWQWALLVEGTRHVCEAMAERGGRAVVVSSIAVYGTHIQDRTCDEDTPFGPWAGAYGRGKQGQETVAREVAATTGLPLTIVRPGNVYGLGGASAFGERLIAALASGAGAVIGDAERNDAGLVYVENLADALVSAATAAEAVGRTYVVCDGNGVSWRRFLDDMAALGDAPPPPAIPLEPLLSQVLANEDPAACVPPKDETLPFLEALNLIAFDNRFDSRRIRRELGWIPRTPYPAALAEMRRQHGGGAR